MRRGGREASAAVSSRLRASSARQSVAGAGDRPRLASVQLYDRAVAAASETSESESEGSESGGSDAGRSSGLSEVGQGPLSAQRGADAQQSRRAASLSLTTGAGGVGGSAGRAASAASIPANLGADPAFTFMTRHPGVVRGAASVHPRHTSSAAVDPSALLAAAAVRSSLAGDAGWSAAGSRAAALSSGAMSSLSSRHDARPGGEQAAAEAEAAALRAENKVLKDEQRLFKLVLGEKAALTASVSALKARLAKLEVENESLVAQLRERGGGAGAKLGSADGSGRHRSAEEAHTKQPAPTLAVSGAAAAAARRRSSALVAGVPSLSLATPLGGSPKPHGGNHSSPTSPILAGLSRMFQR